MIAERLREEMRQLGRGIRNGGFAKRFRPGGRGLIAALIAADVLLLGAVLALGSLQAEEKRLRLSAQSLVDRLAGELIVVQDRLAHTQRTLEDAEAKLEKAESEKQILLSEIEQRDAALNEMGVELAQLKMRSKQVDLGKIVVAGEARKKAIATAAPSVRTPAAPVAGTSDGEVLSFNKEFNFVIVNLGSKQGIKEGMQLELMQDGQAAGALRVDMVDESISAAAVLTQKAPREIAAGDGVRAPR